MIRPEPVILVHLDADGTGPGTDHPVPLTACSGEPHEPASDDHRPDVPRQICPGCYLAAAIHR